VIALNNSSKNDTTDIPSLAYRLVSEAIFLGNVTSPKILDIFNFYFGKKRPKSTKTCGILFMNVKKASKKKK